MSTSVVVAGKMLVGPRAWAEAAPWLLGALVGALSLVPPARCEAQEELEPEAPAEDEAPPQSPIETLTAGMTAYVEAMAGEVRRWEGQRVPWPTPSPRPVAMRLDESPGWGVSVHAAPGLIDRALAAEWTRALDEAHELLSRDGWPLAGTDGGRGGTDGLDVYLVESIAEPPVDPLEDGATGVRGGRRSEVRMDVPLFPTALDGALVHIEVASAVPRDRLLPCALQVVAEAGLFAADPAEAASLRRATGAWLAWSYTGSAGCDEDALARQQVESFRGFVAHDPREGEGGAIFLAAMSQRHDGEGTQFVRELWQLARQRTTDDGDLRGEPDVLRVLGQAADLVHDPLDRALESLAVSRYFAGSDARPTGREVAILRSLPTGAAVPVFGTTTWARLPRTLALQSEPLEPWGSAYARVTVEQAPAGSVLRVWLEGESGTEWSLIAVRIGSDGSERGRTRAPRTRRPRSYIPVELGEGTSEVLLVITNIPDDDDPRDAQLAASRDGRIARRLFRTGLDADAPGPSAHAFRLVIDRGS